MYIFSRGSCVGQKLLDKGQQLVLVSVVPYLIVLPYMAIEYEFDPVPASYAITCKYFPRGNPFSFASKALN